MTLIHNGVQFPKKFETKGFSEKLNISLLAEEMLWKFTPYYFNDKYNANKIFLKNAWRDLKSQLPVNMQNYKFPNDFDFIFMKMRSLNEKIKEQEKIEKKEHKKELEQEKIEKKEKYGFCYKNGEKIPLSNTMVESSRWFISRGELCGSWVSSVKPQDVEINASEEIPCVEGHWKKTELKENVDFIAHYKINVGFGKAFIDKFVWLSPSSEDKQEDTEYKYEKARKLLLSLDDIDSRILKDLNSENELIKENACVAYIISQFGIRIGNDNNHSIRDKNVRGASTLCVENIFINDDDVKLSFVGKDSVVYCETMTCNPLFVKIISNIICGKKSTDKIFSKATSMTVNAYLKSIYDGEISPKLFRTVRATSLLAKQFQSKDWKNLTDKEFKNMVNLCCFEVTKSLNHKKTLSKEQSEKIDISIKEKLKKAKQKYNEDKTKIELHIMKLNDDVRKAKIRFSGKILIEKLASINDKKKQFQEKLIVAEKKYNDLKENLVFKKESKDANISTAINSYSSPTLSYSLCKYANKNPSLLYSKTQLEKFAWAEKVDETYFMRYPHVD